ncbi:glycosyltransferase family 2 protein [cf. Phormidesmis sp. LEGE 11477]|uniref:glycosyltransferase n=1 Tax=cf. Phormidesmis sp. LEGE 11477 TaxID=1828680 RepID=UPI00188310BE|nr:glycosyltransferase [cf. Phormidesmis sp. LEGE 11477]MBE9060879.1 glycosyltransferase [cf. Phormidesmis sp. LEGE 11477]
MQTTLLPRLTSSPPLADCRVSVIIPVRNEAENLPAVIQALANQVDSRGDVLSPNSYETLVLANNCTDNTVEVAKQLSACYPLLQLQIVQASLPKEIAHVGKARQMAMDEAYRRLSLIGRQNRIIASTDGDTQVASNWISALLNEFDKGVDAVGGRIITCRSRTLDIDPKVSLYYLRHIAHAYISAQMECSLDPQMHDCWPRHFQYYGANMAISAEMYGHVGGLPLVKDEEDVALYQRLRLADAKIRHSPDVRVFTSARRVGRATGGLAELLETLTNASQTGQTVLVESPEITEGRILIRRHLRQVWAILQSDRSFNIKDYVRTTDILAKGLGVPEARLQRCIETASTFGRLVATVSDYQAHQTDACQLRPTTEISAANMRLRQRLQAICQSSKDSSRPHYTGTSLVVILKALQQVQAIPLFSPAH